MLRLTLAANIVSVKQKSGRPKYLEYVASADKRDDDDSVLS